MPKLIHHFLTSLGYAFYLVSCTLFVLLFVPIGLLLSLAPKLRQILFRWTVRNYMAFLTRYYLPFIRLYKIGKFEGFSDLPDKPLIIIANHAGKLDGLLLMGNLPPCGVLMKKKYTNPKNRPIYATLSHFFDFIPSDSRSSAVMQATFDRCKKLFLEGKHLLVFPEGQRAVSSRILPFAKFAFKLAMELDIDIAPVVVYSSFPFMSKNLGSYFPPATFRFSIRRLPLVSPKAYSSSSQLSDDIRKMMMDGLNQLKNEEVFRP